MTQDHVSGERDPRPDPERETARRSRNDVVDALRGSALAGILLLHAIQHWGCTRYPEASADPPVLDVFAYRIGIFLFFGKAYAIFALLFGMGTWTMLDRWSRRGVNVHGRHLWRLTVLGTLGYLNGIIYSGDILLSFAVLAIPLAVLDRMGTRSLVWACIVLFSQLPLLGESARVVLDHGYEPARPHHWPIYEQLAEVYAHGSWLDVSATNLVLGQSAKIWWTIETGRHLQLMGLFVCGLLLGRSRVVEDPARCARVAASACLGGLIAWAILFPLALQLPRWGLTGLRGDVVDRLLSSYVNLAQSAVWMGVFVLLYQRTRIGALLGLFVPFGRTSLTGYLTQGLVGVLLFYGYGLGLYRELGPFYSLLVGTAIFAVQCLLASLWLGRFALGPVERLWRVVTFA